MNLIVTGNIESPVRLGYCTFRVNGDFYMLRFDQNLQQSIESAVAMGKRITITGTGHTFRCRDCGKHRFYIKAQSID